MILQTRGPSANSIIKEDGSRHTVERKKAEQRGARKTNSFLRGMTPVCSEEKNMKNRICNYIYSNYPTLKMLGDKKMKEEALRRYFAGEKSYPIKYL